MWYLVCLLIGAFILPATAMNKVITYDTIFPVYENFYEMIPNKSIDIQTNANTNAWIAFFEVPYASAPKYEIRLSGYYGRPTTDITRNRTTLLSKVNFKVINYYGFSFFTILPEHFTSTNSLPGAVDFKLSVFKTGENMPFLSMSEHDYLEVKYFSVATTGTSISALWALLGETYKVIKKPANVTRELSYEDNPYPNYYRIMDNVIRFKVEYQEDLKAWIRLTAKQEADPCYRVMLSLSPNLFGAGLGALYRGTDILTTFSIPRITSGNKVGIWILLEATSDVYGYSIYIITVGKEEDKTSNIVRYRDTSPKVHAKYFSIATSTYNGRGAAFWDLLDLWP